MADQLCTSTQVKARLFPAGASDATDDTLISELIDEVSDWIQTTTRRKLVPDNAATYVVDTSSGSVIYVRRGIRTVTALSIASSDQPDTGGTYTAVTLSDVVLRPLTIDLKPGWPPEMIMIKGTYARFGAYLNGATITGNFGFAATPPAIQAACIDGVVAAYQMRKNGATGVLGVENTPGVPWWQFSQASKRILDIYRGIGMA